MSIEALKSADSQFIHRPCHDLESLLYVILFVCSSSNGPGDYRNYKNNPATMSMPIRTWFDRASLREAARRKIAHMSAPDFCILDQLDPYWDDFKPFLRQLISTCFLKGIVERNCLTHDNMVSILSHAAEAVAEPKTLGKRPKGESGDVPESPRKKSKDRVEVHPNTM